MEAPVPRDGMLRHSGAPTEHPPLLSPSGPVINYLGAGKLPPLITTFRYSPLTALVKGLCAYRTWWVPRGGRHIWGVSSLISHLCRNLGLAVLGGCAGTGRVTPPRWPAVRAGEGGLGVAGFRVTGLGLSTFLILHRVAD